MYALEQELFIIIFLFILNFYVKLYSYNQAHTESVNAERFLDFHKTETFVTEFFTPPSHVCLLNIWGKLIIQ